MAGSLHARFCVVALPLGVLRQRATAPCFEQPLSAARTAAMGSVGIGLEGKVLNI